MSSELDLSYIESVQTGLAGVTLSVEDVVVVSSVVVGSLVEVVVVVSLVEDVVVVSS